MILEVEASEARGGPAPAEPADLPALGLSAPVLRSLVLKACHRLQLNTVSALARALCVSPLLAQQLSDLLRQDGLMEALGTDRFGSGEIRLQLTEAGRQQALAALALSGYAGPLPVPLKDWSAQVARQSIRQTSLNRPALLAAFQHLVLPSMLVDQLGPAVRAGRSILLYGPPGNGKSSIAEAICSALGERIYIPYAVEYQGQIISVYDPVIHRPLATPAPAEAGLRREGPAMDPRYVACRRPSVTTGGELTLDMLDLIYSPASQTCQAPLQMKAAGGLFIVDDLGRQRDPPQALVNRWIVPMEDGHDYLTLPTGEKFRVPFDCLVIFSTNFHPNRIFDQAALRRIFSKIRIDGPDQEGFLNLLALMARKRGVPLDEAALVHLIRNKYPTIDNLYAAYHAGFLLDQIVAICEFEGIPNQMTPALIDRAWSNLVVELADVDH